MVVGRFERTISSEYPFAGKLLKVRVDEILLPSGRRTKREVVVHRGAVGIVAIQDSQVLLERQYRHTTKRVMWEIPAGTIEEGESPRECAIRELREETGYLAKKLEELTHFFVAVGYSTEVMRIFLATGLSKAKASPEEDESIETVMVPIEEALNMIRKNKIQDAKSIVGLLLARDWVNSHRFLRGELL